MKAPSELAPFVCASCNRPTAALPWREGDDQIFVPACLRCWLDGPAGATVRAEDLSSEFVTLADRREAAIATRTRIDVTQESQFRHECLARGFDPDRPLATQERIAT